MHAGRIGTRGIETPAIAETIDLQTIPLYSKTTSSNMMNYFD